MESVSLEKYANMDFPMFWRLDELRANGAMALAEALAKRKSLENATNMFWRMFAIDLVICYEQFALQNHVQALEALAKCHGDIEDLKACGDPLYAYSPEALAHVVVATRGFVLTAMPGLLARGTIVLDNCFLAFKENIKVTKYQSALIGIRSAVFMAYGVPGARKAKVYIGEALRLDNNVAEWHFLYGKCMGRLRRIFTYTDIPSDFELKHHKLAVSLTQGKVPYYIVYLAQCQREMAFRLGRCEEIAVPLPEKSIQLFDQSSENYNTAYRMAAHCCHVLARCALGFLKMPDPFGNAVLAHQIMGKVVDLCPDNPMVHHIWALINERGLRDPKVALIFFQKAAEKDVFVGWIDLIRLTYLEHKDAYNPTPDLMNLLTLFTDAHLRDRILIQIGSFYLFQKNYIFKALEYIMDVFDKDPGSQNLTIHRNVFMGLGRPINLLQVVFDDCRLKCAHPKTKDFVKKSCKEVVILWTLIYPELTNNKPKDLRKEILQESFLYTHPWARSRGRERHRREVKNPDKKTESKYKSSTRSLSKSGAEVKIRKEPEFQPYVPDSNTILKGWLTAEEQLAKHKGHQKWKRAKNQRRKGGSPTSSATRLPFRTNEEERKSEDTRQESLSRGSSVEPSRSRAESTETRIGGQGNDWRSARNASMHRMQGKQQPSRDSYIPKSYKSDYSRSTSLGTATRAASVNWRTERLSAESTGSTESEEKPIVPTAKFFSQSSRSNRAHWSNMTSSVGSASGTASAGWPAQNTNHSQGSPLRSTSSYSDNRSWRSASLGPSTQHGTTSFRHTHTAEDSGVGRASYQRRTTSNTRNAPS